MPKSITTFQSSKQLHNSTMLSLRYEITIKYQYYLDIQTRQYNNVLKLIICLTFTISIRVLCISIKIYWKFVEECTHIRQHFFRLLRIVTGSYLVLIDFSLITRLGCCLSNIILKSYFLTFTQVDQRDNGLCGRKVTCCSRKWNVTQTAKVILIDFRQLHLHTLTGHNLFIQVILWLSHFHTGQFIYKTFKQIFIQQLLRP